MNAPELPRISDYSPFMRDVTSRELLTHRAVRLTYGEVEELSTRYARALLAAGVRKGDRVAVMGNPRPEFFVSFLATARIGGVWQGLNPKYKRGELHHVVGDAAPVVLIAMDSVHEPALQQARTDAGRAAPGHSWRVAGRVLAAG